MQKKRQPIPSNWEVVMKGKNTIYRCPIKSGDQRCTFVGRASTLREHLELNNHIFEIVKPEEDRKKQTENVGEKIEHLVLEMGGSLQLSLSQLASPNLTQLIQGIISVTGNYIINHQNEAFFPETFYSGMSRNTIKERIIDFSQLKAKTKRDNLRRFSKFVALSLDAGTVESHQLLEFLISNASSGFKPVLLYSADFPKHTSEKFLEELKVAISKAHEENFHVVAIVADNVQYQKKVLAHWRSNCPLNDEADPTLNSLLYITCNCHDLDLVVTQLIKENGLFSSVAKAANLLADLSRRKKYCHYFNAAAPRVPTTRWLYLFDFTSWIMNNSDKILNFLEHSEIIIDKFPVKKEKYQILSSITLQDFQKVHALLGPLRKLSDKLESDQCQICYVVPLVELCFNELKKVKDSELFQKDDTAKKLLCIFTARFRKTAVADVLCLSYALTSEGRFCLGCPPDLSEHERQEEEKKYYQLTKAPILLKETFAKDRITPNEKVKYREAFDRYIKSAVEAMSTHSYKSYHEELEKLANERDIEEVFYDKYVKAEQALKRHLIRMKCDEELFKSITKQFSSFIHSRDPELLNRLELYLHFPPHDMWKNMSTSNLLKELSYYALMICAIPASEASVERIFSSVKKYLSTRQRSSNALTEAYINLLPDTYREDLLSFDLHDDESMNEEEEQETPVQKTVPQKSNPQQRSIQNYFLPE